MASGARNGRSVVAQYEAVNRNGAARDQMNVVLLPWEGQELCIGCFRDRFSVAYESLTTWMRMDPLNRAAGSDMRSLYCRSAD